MFILIIVALIYLYILKEEFEDTKRGNQKDEQYDGQKKKDKRTNNDLQKMTQETKN
jgi:hypothetical protein